MYAVSNFELITTSTHLVDVSIHEAYVVTYRLICVICFHCVIIYHDFTDPLIQPRGRDASVLTT